MPIGSLIIVIINLFLISLVTYRVVTVDNDKGIAVFMFFYFVLIGLNLILWAVLSLFKSRLKIKMGRIISGLVILFISILIYLAQR